METVRWRGILGSRQAGSCLRLIGLLLALLASAALSQDKDQSSRCIQMKTCGQCLAAGPPCGWCSQEKYAMDDRCNLVERLVSTDCDPSHIVNPVSTIQYNKNEGARNADRYTDAIQLSPQEVTIKMRPNEPYKFKVSFRQAENYPVDLYYVMDLSNSMEDDKENLAKLGSTLASEMNKITQNFRLGFGSFVDKMTMPYVSTVPEKLMSPCTGCVAPYGFHNQLRLTDDTPQFEAKVRDARISGNLDSPEGGFDAIMQAIACQNDIGWRNQSRKMLLFSTDAGFHYAGDGKLGGIVMPNDGSCHLDRNGYYSESLNQDYPSISQLSHRIAEQKVNVIFAVTQNQVPVYTKLSGFIEGSTTGELAEDSRNIVELVKENYRKISGSLVLKTESDEDLSVIFRSKCLSNDTMIEGKGEIKCDGLGIAQNVTFEVSVETQTCPTDRRLWNKSFKIYPIGLNEALTVHVELNCECDCELPHMEVENSPRCNMSGTYECGACTCNPGRYGQFCECDGTTVSDRDYDAACKANGSDVVCGGHGKCVCGTCQCNSVSSTGDQSWRYSGKFCDCNNYNCDLQDNLLCGGPEKGICECGTCVCRPGWKYGPQEESRACGCSTDTSTCVAKNGKECNGFGHCKCGVCECDRSSTYKGPTCEDCDLCPEECDRNKPCVQCWAYKTYSTMSKEDCEANCSHVQVVKELGQNEDQVNWRLCRFRDDDNCDAVFEYHYNNKTLVKAQETKECPEPVPVLWIILGVILGIILIGLALLLIWKLLVTIHDRREFARFEKERENARWDMGENPIYKQATSTYSNPMYANKS